MAVDLAATMTIGEICTRWPSTFPVITRYFHGGCHHCPSQHTEPLWLAARMYGVSIETLLAELIEAASQPQEQTTPVLTARERRLERENRRDFPE